MCCLFSLWRELLNIWCVDCYRSNGLSLLDSDGFGISVAICGMFDEWVLLLISCHQTNLFRYAISHYSITNRSATICTRPPLLLGTIAKACLNPNNMGGMGTVLPQASHMFDIWPMRPRKILFQTREELEMIAPDLHSWGITQFDVAEQSLQRSLEL